MWPEERHPTSLVLVGTWAAGWSSAQTGCAEDKRVERACRTRRAHKQALHENQQGKNQGQNQHGQVARPLARSPGTSLSINRHDNWNAVSFPSSRISGWARLASLLSLRVQGGDISQAATPSASWPVSSRSSHTPYSRLCSEEKVSKHSPSLLLSPERHFKGTRALQGDKS